MFQWLARRKFFGFSLIFDALALAASSFGHVQMLEEVVVAAQKNTRNFNAHKMLPLVMGDVRLLWESSDRHGEASAVVENLADKLALLMGFDQMAT